MSRVINYFSSDKLNEIIEKIKAKGDYAYHYTSPEGFRGIFRDKGNLTLWFTQYDSLNDKSERKHTFEYISEYCDRKVTEKVFSEEFGNYIKKFKPSDYKHVLTPNQTEDEGNLLNGHSIERFECDIYICSFSKHDDILPMWNYYSKSQRYEGYSIGFSTQHFFKAFRGHGLELINVVYDSDKKDALLDELLIPLSKVFDDNPTEPEHDNIKGIINIVFDRLQFAFKNSCFSHEQEMRLVLWVPKETRRNGIKNNKDKKSPAIVSERKYRTNNGYLIPYVEYTFPSYAVQSIKIAPLQEIEIAKKNVIDFLKHYGYGTRDVSSSDIPIRF